MQKVLLVSVLFFVVIGLVIGMACSDKNTQVEQPTMPSSGILTVDFSTFTDASMERPAEHCADFDTAAALVTVWAQVTNAILVMPRLAFVIAVLQPATYDADMGWSWGIDLDENVSINMTAQVVSGDSVEWMMFITNVEDSLDHFLWYLGRCNFGADGGWWEFYDPDLPADSNDVLWVGWEENESDTTGKLTLVNTDETDDGCGDTLYYELDGSTAFVWLHDVDSERPGRWEITWDIDEHYGMITYPEGESRCWDSALECADCDSIPLR